MGALCYIGSMFFLGKTQRIRNVQFFLFSFLPLVAVAGAVFPSPRLSAAQNFRVMAEDQWLMSVYEKGKDHYDHGDYQGAVAEWGKLNDIIDRYPAFKTVIDYLRGRAKSISPDKIKEVEQKLAERERQIDFTFQQN